MRTAPLYFDSSSRFDSLQRIHRMPCSSSCCKRRRRTAMASDVRQQPTAPCLNRRRRGCMCLRLFSPAQGAVCCRRLAGRGDFRLLPAALLRWTWVAHHCVRRGQSWRRHRCWSRMHVVCWRRRRRRWRNGLCVCGCWRARRCSERCAFDWTSGRPSAVVGVYRGSDVASKEAMYKTDPSRSPSNRFSA
ncbi:hypothetical protein BC567DRAFT_87556 [Phyllosticta citribraziliensis]